MANDIFTIFTIFTRMGREDGWTMGYFHYNHSFGGGGGDDGWMSNVFFTIFTIFTLMRGGGMMKG